MSGSSTLSSGDLSGEDDVAPFWNDRYASQLFNQAETTYLHLFAENRAGNATEKDLFHYN